MAVRVTHSRDGIRTDTLYSEAASWAEGPGGSLFVRGRAERRGDPGPVVAAYAPGQWQTAEVVPD